MLQNHNAVFEIIFAIFIFVILPFLVAFLATRFPGEKIAEIEEEKKEKKEKASSIEVKPKKVKNPLEFIGASLLIISVLILPYFKVPLFGGIRVLELYDFVRGVGKLSETLGTATSSRSGAEIFLAIFLLILISGIISIFNSKVGGVIGLIGIILITIVSVGIGKELGISGLSFLDFGYYVAWIGVVLCLFPEKILKLIK